MRAYFAYGSNMAQEQMTALCPGASVSGTAVLSGYRFIINRLGYATLLPDKQCAVPGVLWQIRDSDEAALDQFENFDTGLQDKCIRRVRMANGKETAALVYIDHQNQTLGIPKDGYLTPIIAAAQAHALPAVHVALLQAWPNRRGLAAINGCLERLKDVHEAGNRIAAQGRELAIHLKPQRDAILLEALDEIGCEGTTEALQECYWELLLRHAEDIVQEWDSASKTRQATEQVAVLRFLAALVKLRQQPWEPPGDADAGEIGTAGVIITATPVENHGGDRIIITHHAPALARLWSLLQLADEDLPPPSMPRITLFANAAVKHGAAESFEPLLYEIVDTLYEEVMGVARAIVPDCRIHPEHME